MSDLSRVEQQLRNALGEGIYNVTPRSRVEILLAQLNELIEGLNTSVDPETIASIVTDWLAENIHDGAVVDTSLSVAGAAAESEKVGDELSDLKEDLSDIAEAEKWNLLDGATPIDRTFLNVDGTTSSNNSTFYFDKIQVDSDTTYYFYNESIANSYGSNGYDDKYCARTILFYDSNEELIQNATLNYTKSPITTPSNCKYLSICGKYKDNATQDIGINWLTRKGINEHEDATNIIASVPIENVTGLNDELNSINRKLTDYPPVQLVRKPTFVFIFDDGTDGDVNTKALFDSYGFKCGFALSAVQNSESARKNIIQRYIPYQDDGFEILSHSINGTAFNSITDLAISEEYLKTSINTLRDWGFDVEGWVTPSTWMLETQFPLLCKYYQYGFGHLENTNVVYTNTFNGKDIRQLDRWSLQSNTIENTMSQIQSCINNNGIMIFYGHSYPQTSDNMTVENMATILNFLKEKSDDGEIIVDIPRNAINNYYSFRRSDYLNLINT